RGPPALEAARAKRRIMTTQDTANRFQVSVSAEEAGERLDRFLARRLSDFSRSRLQALIRAREVTRDGIAAGDMGHRVKAGETYTVNVPAPTPAAPQAQAIPLAGIYEDAHLIVIDKPKGLAVHPGPGHTTGTLVNALIAHCGASLSGIGGVKRPGIVHRLDKDTSGLMVVAKNDAAHASLTAQFADHGRTGEMRRGYLAFVWGVPNRQRGTVDAPIDRHPHAREKMAVREGGREAVTHWEVREV